MKCEHIFYGKNSPPPPQILRSQAQGAALISGSAVYIYIVFTVNIVFTKKIYAVKIFKADQFNLVYAIVFHFLKNFVQLFCQTSLTLLIGKVKRSISQ